MIVAGLMVAVLMFPLQREADTVRSQFPPGGQVTAMAVMLRESSGDPNAVGAAGEKGIFQLMDAPSCWRDVECNTRAAVQLWRKRGWQPWTAYTSGRYRRFLPEARALLSRSGKSAGRMHTVSSIGRRTAVSTCRTMRPGPAEFGVLAIGSRGTIVRHAQSRLRISPDGIYGQRTRATAGRYQHKKGLHVDGQIGRQTACALRLTGGKVETRQASSVRTFHLPARSPRIARVLRMAHSLLGIPYVRGGASRAGLDCSGFTMLAYRAGGWALPHYSGAQPAHGQRVSRPLPGDLVWWPGHVAIYDGRSYVVGARHTGVRSQRYRIYGSPRFYRMR